MYNAPITNRERNMKRKKWDSKTKWHIVLEGKKGRPVADICAEYNVAP